MPCASTNGLATTRTEASTGSRPTFAASVGTAQASSTSPSTAASRYAVSSSHGSWVRCENAPPQASDNGPYGDGVVCHSGETPERSGSGSTAGVHR